MAKTKGSGISGGGGATGGVATGGGTGPTTGGGAGGGYAKGWAATGPNGTLSADDYENIYNVLKEADEALTNNKISLKQYLEEKQELAYIYGISVADVTDIWFEGGAPSGGGTDNKPESEKPATKKAEGEKPSGKKAASAVEAAKGMELAGQNGNKWPPSANNSSYHYGWHTGMDIFNKYGGSYKDGGVGGQNSKEMYSAIKSFTGSGYTSIRKAQLNGDTTSAAGKKGQKLEDFIAEGVKRGHGWKGGATYRGIGVSDSVLETFKSMSVGDTIDCNGGGSASWSTHRPKSEQFAKSYGGPNRVVFVHTGKTQNGVSVKNLSTIGPSEYEVLCSKNNKYKVQAVVPATSTYGSGQSSYTYIYVEDA